MPADRKDKLAKSNPLAIRTAADMTDALLPGKPVQMMKSGDGKSLLFKQFKLTPTGLEVHGAITIDDWKSIGQFFGQTGSALKCWIGDWLNKVPHAWGDMYTEAEALTGLKIKTLQNIAYVCRSVESSRRREQLSFKHLAFVAAKTPEDQDKWLKFAVDEKLSANRLGWAMNPPPLPDPAHPPSPLFDRKHRRKFNRLWKSVMSKDPAKISRADIQHVRVWLDEVEEGLDTAEQGETNVEQ